MHIWCPLIPKEYPVLNLLQKSRINPIISAYTQVHGEYDFNAAPIAPPGTHVAVRETQKSVEAGQFG